MTKRAMATAMYPEPEKGGRGKKGKATVAEWVWRNGGPPSPLRPRPRSRSGAVMRTKLSIFADQLLTIDKAASFVRATSRNVFKFAVICSLERQCAGRMATDDELERAIITALKITPVPRPLDLPADLPVDHCLKQLT